MAVTAIKRSDGEMGVMRVVANEKAPVLIVGGAYTGLSAALGLAAHGVRPLMVERRPTTSTLPKAWGLNARTMELLSTVPGVGDDLRAAQEGLALPRIRSGSSLAAAELIEVDPSARLAMIAQLTPSPLCLLSQATIEKIMRARAEELGADLRYGTEVVSWTQDADKVIATLRDVSDGSERTVHADYLVAADGYTSPIRTRLGIPLEGGGKVGHLYVITFEADLSGNRPAQLMITGYVFSGELERIAGRAAYLGEWLLVLILAAFGGYIGWKYYNRRRFLRKLRIARITPEELKEKIDSGEDVIIVDLRHALDFDAQPETIPGALHMDAAELEEAHEVIPRDREIVLFCACPNEVTAARLALLLRSKGITRIRPLAEGYEGWRSRGFPMSRPKAEPQDAQPVVA